MKTMNLAVLGLMFFSGATSASGSLLPTGSVRGNLDFVRMDRAHGPSYQFKSGIVTVNQYDKTVTLMLFNESQCRSNGCLPVRPVEIQVELEDVTFDNCGTVTYFGRSDQRRVDGPLKTIEVRDNSENICPHFVYLAPTEVLYKVTSSGMDGRIFHAESYMSGTEALHPSNMGPRPRR